MDEFTRAVIAEFKRAAREKESYTIPWLDLDIPAYLAYRSGLSRDLPRPYCFDPAARLMMTGVQDLDVLCLAGGGGQQSAVYSLLGARVTVFDLMEEQLQGDRAAAQYYGYAIQTIQGDMTDLSALSGGSFDRVHQPISTLYTPDLEKVYGEVHRVLRPGGLYYADFTFPLLYLADVAEWDGGGYPLRVTQAYRRGPLFETDEGKLCFDAGKPVGEYHYRLSDIINELIAAGLTLRGLWESPRPGVSTDDMPTPDGLSARQSLYIPFGLSLVAAYSD